MVKILNLPSTRQQIGAAFGQGIATGTQQLLQNLQQQKMQERQFEQQKELQRLKQEGKQPGFLQTPGGIQATAQLLESQGFNQNDIQQILQTGDEQLVRSVLKSNVSPSARERFSAGLRRNFGFGTSAAGQAPGGQGGILDFLNEDPAQQQQQQVQQPLQELSQDIASLAPMATQAALTQDTNAGAGSAAAAAGRPPGQVPTQFIDPQVQPELAASQQQPRLAPEQQRQVGVAPALAPPGIPSAQQNIEAASIAMAQQATSPPLEQQPGLSPLQNEAVSGRPIQELQERAYRPLGIVGPPTQAQAEQQLADRQAAKLDAAGKSQLPREQQLNLDLLDNPETGLKIQEAQARSNAFFAQEVARSALDGLIALPSFFTKLADIATYGKTPLWKVNRYIDSIPGSIIPKRLESPSELETRLADAAGFFTSLGTGGAIGGALSQAFQGAKGLGAIARGYGNLMNVSPQTALKLTGGRTGAKLAARWYGTSERGEELAGLAGQFAASLFEIRRGLNGLREEAAPLYDRVTNAGPDKIVSLDPVRQNLTKLSRKFETLQGQTGFNQVAPVFEQLDNLARTGKAPIAQFAQIKQQWNNLGFDQGKSNSIAKFAKEVTASLRDVTSQAAQSKGPAQELARDLLQADKLWTLANSRNVTASLANKLFRFNSPLRMGTLVAGRMLGIKTIPILAGAAAGIGGIGLANFTAKTMFFDPTGRSLLQQSMIGLANGSARDFNDSLRKFDRYMGRRAPTTIRNDRGKQVEVAFNMADRVMVPPFGKGRS